jgi:hypothetical protein
MLQLIACFLYYILWCAFRVAALPVRRSQVVADREAEANKSARTRADRLFERPPLDTDIVLQHHACL